MDLIVEKLIYGGDGLARLPADEHGRGKAVFLPFVLPGEEAEASLIEQKPGFARARLDAIVKPSPQRVQPGCPYFQKCGGCHYQHAGYEYQLELKAAILKENLRRIAKLELDTELQIHSSSPWNYRNRSRLRIQTAPEFVMGYYRFGSHDLLAVEECPISSPLINRAISALWQEGRANRIPEGIQEIELAADAEDGHLLVELYCSEKTTAPTAGQWTEQIRQALPQAVGCVAFKASRIQGEAKRLAAAGVPEVRYVTGPRAYRVSAGSFFQVNRHLVDELVKLVTEGQAGSLACDLYAGVGLFSSVLAGSFAQVIAVESSQTAHADLLYNSPSNVTAVRTTADRYLEKEFKGRPDLVVVDPPRTGLGAGVIRLLGALGAPRVTYVSCDPATLPRDLVGLLHSGYRVEQAHLIDLFPQTYHMESVFHLVR